MNIFQRIKKNRIIKNLNIETYINAPSYIKEDEEVINVLVDKYKNQIPIDIKKIILNKYPKYINELMHFSMYSYLLENKHLLEYLEDNYIIEMLKFHNEWSNEVLGSISDKKLESIIAKDTSFIKNENIKGLDKKIQLLLIKNDKSKIMGIDSNIIMEIINNNSISQRYMQDRIKEENVPIKNYNNSSLYQKLSPTEKISRSEELTDEQFDQLLGENIEGLKITEETLKRIINNNMLYPLSYNKINNLQKIYIENNLLKEQARITPEILHFNNDKNINKHIVEQYINILKNNDINDNEVFNIIKQQVELNEKEKFNRLSIVLSNEKVLEKCNKEMIIDYIKNPNIEKLVSIVETTYGRTAANIIKNRINGKTQINKLPIEFIPNLHIFDERALETLGYGTIDSFITYASSGSTIVANMVLNPEMIIKYNEFKKISAPNYQLDIQGIEKQLIMYQRMYSRIKNIDLKSLSKEQIDNILLYINDIENNIQIKDDMSLDEVLSYSAYRKQSYDEAIDNLEKIPVFDSSALKNIVLEKYFGLDASKLEYLNMRLSLESFINETITKQNISRQDINQLEIMLAILKENSIDNIKLINDKLSKLNFETNPIVFRKIISSSNLLYKRELSNNLTKASDIEQMLQSNSKGISQKIDENNIRVITLDGADFKMLVHSTKYLENKTSVEDYLNREYKGTDTISTQYIDSNLIDHITGLNNVCYGYTDVEPMGIYAMGPRDIAVPHPGEKIHIDNNIYGIAQYPKMLINNASTGSFHDEKNSGTHAEVAIKRYNSPQEINEKGRRVIPNYIVSFGPPTSEHFKEVSDFRKYGYDIPIIVVNIEAYKDKYRRYELDSNIDQKKDIIEELDETVRIR